MRILPKNINKKYIKLSIWVLASLFVLISITGAIAYSKREKLLKTAIDKAISKAKKDYHLDVKIENYAFAGLSTVELKNISVVPEGRDSLLKIDDFSVGVKLFPLIFGDVKLAQLKLNNGHLNLVLRDSTTNIDFILKRKNRDTTNKQTNINLSDVASNLLNQVLYKIPDNMDLKGFEFRLNDNDTAHVSFLTTDATIKNGAVNSTIKVNGTESVWHVKGQVDPGNKQLDLSLFADGKKVQLPYLERKLHARMSFDTVRTELKKAGRSSGEYRIYGFWSVKNLTINHPRLAANDIVIPNGAIDANMFIGENYVSIDSSSTIYMDKVKAHPYIKYTLKPKKIYELKVQTDEMDAQQLFNSFPHGIFETVEGIQVTGKLQYNLNFYLDSSKPDDVVFDSQLRPIGFKVLKWGKTDLQKLNSTFSYTPYEYGKPMRNITIGPQNPNFTPLDQISSNLKNAVLTAEDPSFFSHKGFVEESIRKSIAVNYKEKKFKRGGSTISMQLVKNIYLSRQKTLSRKIEEMLIVWMIENNRLSSKQRMLEVYFNMIELGRNVYGIGEASRYYFGKSPAELTIGESLFLASIVPKPKTALYKFLPDGGLKPYMLPYFKFIGGIMARRGLTPSDTSGYGFYNVRLKESLRSQIAPAADSTKVDTLDNGNNDDMFPPLQPAEKQEERPGFLHRLFGGGKKKDTVEVKSHNTSTVKDTVKTGAERRKERREKKRKEREERAKNQ